MGLHQFACNAVSKKTGNPNVTDLIVQVLQRYIDFDIVFGMTGKEAIFRLLKEHLLDRAEKSFLVAPAQAGGHVAGGGGSCLLDHIGMLAGQLCRRRAGPAGIGEYVDRSEPNFF